ncbi:hypothetical protein N9L68_08720, partial [bacterium]|nr:hypothetical protein [bacterium]
FDSLIGRSSENNVSSIIADVHAVLSSVVFRPWALPTWEMTMPLRAFSTRSSTRGKRRVVGRFAFSDHGASISVFTFPTYRNIGTATFPGCRFGYRTGAPHCGVVVAFQVEKRAICQPLI